MFCDVVATGRRLAVAAVAAATLSWMAPELAAQSPITVTDLRGRKVVLREPAKKLLIDDGRYLIALSLLHENPVSLIGGWPRDINRIGEKTYEQYRSRFPAIETIPQVSSSAGSFSVEHVLAVKPSVAVFSLGRGPSDEQLKLLEAAGIPAVFIDFFTQPFENVQRSVEILGELIGRRDRAAEFVAFRNSRIANISARLKSLPAASEPLVFLEAHAGMSEECCNSPGRGNIGDYIAMVRGRNIGADVITGATGKLNLEYVISRKPAVYIATGGPHLEKTGGLVVGAEFTEARARQSLKTVAARSGIALLPAVKNGAVFGLAHQILNSPVDILAIEVMAKWVHPSLFGDVNPEATKAELNKRFLAVPIEGTYWVTIK